MKTIRLRWVPLLVVMCVFFTGCDSSDDHRTPPVGKGSIYIDNISADRLRVYLNGGEVESIGTSDERYYDLNPGVYRVSLDGSSTDRSWRGDVDVLEGRITIMEVFIDGVDYTTYRTRIYFD